MNPLERAFEGIVFFLVICAAFWLLGFWQQRTLKRRDDIHVPKWLAAICGNSTGEVDKHWLVLQLGDAGLFLIMAFMFVFIPPGQDRVHIAGLAGLGLFAAMIIATFVLDRRS